MKQLVCIVLSVALLGLQGTWGGPPPQAGGVRPADRGCCCDCEPGVTAAPCCCATETEPSGMPHEQSCACGLIGTPVDGRTPAMPASSPRTTPSCPATHGTLFDTLLFNPKHAERPGYLRYASARGSPTQPAYILLSVFIS